MGNEKGNPAKSSHTEHAEHIVSWEEQVEKKKPHPRETWWRDQTQTQNKSIARTHSNPTEVSDGSAVEKNYSATRCDFKVHE